MREVLSVCSILIPHLASVSLFFFRPALGLGETNIDTFDLTFCCSSTLCEFNAALQNPPKEENVTSHREAARSLNLWLRLHGCSNSRVMQNFKWYCLLPLPLPQPMNKSIRRKVTRVSHFQFRLTQPRTNDWGLIRMYGMSKEQRRL